MGVVYFSITPTFEPSRYYKCWIVCFYHKNSGEEIVQIFSRVLLSQGRDMYYLLEFRDGYITIYRFPVSIKIIYGFQNMSLCQCS